MWVCERAWDTEMQTPSERQKNPFRAQSTSSSIVDSDRVFLFMYHRQIVARYPMMGECVRVCLNVPVFI